MSLRRGAPHHQARLLCTSPIVIRAHCAVHCGPAQLLCSYLTYSLLLSLLCIILFALLRGDTPRGFL